MPAKKAAKKSAKHADPKHHEGKDLRRAYEHLGRVEAMQPSLPSVSAKGIQALVALAEGEWSSGHAKEAADLLRAAEHLSFAALAGSGASKVSDTLQTVIEEEFDRLTSKAEEHWRDHAESERHEAVTVLYRSSLDGAAAALDGGTYRKALELARAAEALAHVKQHAAKKLEAGAQPKLSSGK